MRSVSPRGIISQGAISWAVCSFFSVFRSFFGSICYIVMGWYPPPPRSAHIYYLCFLMSAGAREVRSQSPHLFPNCLFLGISFHSWFFKYAPAFLLASRRLFCSSRMCTAGHYLGALFRGLLVHLGVCLGYSCSISASFLRPSSVRSSSCGSPVWLFMSLSISVCLTS